MHLQHRVGAPVQPASTWHDDCSIECMSTIRRMLDWSELNRDVWLDLFRIALGAGLFMKGLSLLRESDVIGADALSHGMPFAGGTSVYFAALLHLVGGTMMTFGLLTRLAALVQIPNVIFAMMFVHARDGIFTGSQGMVLRLMVLALLVAFAFMGSGRLSTDWYFTDHPRISPDERRDLARDEAALLQAARGK